MIKIPKKTKYRKRNKSRILKGFNSINSSQLQYGSFGLKALYYCRLTISQLEATRKVISKKMNKIGKIWICKNPNLPVTKKPIAIRMGKGKGAVNYWASFIKPGMILYEIDHINSKHALNALRCGALKLPIKTSIIFRKKKGL